MTIDTINNGGPAFPGIRIEAGDNYNPPKQFHRSGMSLRDYFAAKAMLALLTHHGGYTGDEAHQSSIPCLREDVLDVDSLAQYAYSQADAMLAERWKK